MNRYFVELSYKGTAYAGFQVQQNAVTIQSQVEKAFAVYFRKAVTLTGSSRTDAGVHAFQNYFHFDMPEDIDAGCIYNLNALLPGDIAINSIRLVGEGAHCRFDAIYRHYIYRVYSRKDPFISDMAYYFPFRLDVEAMRRAAAAVKEYRDFSSFAKRNSQVRTFNCNIRESEWVGEGNGLAYRVQANRFLRGMVRGLVGTMLQVGRGRLSVDGFRKIIEGGDSSKADFSVPGHGLCLQEVGYPEGYFQLTEK